jgi:hypothetical protein
MFLSRVSFSLSLLYCILVLSNEQFNVSVVLGQDLVCDSVEGQQQESSYEVYRH